MPNTAGICESLITSLPGIIIGGLITWIAARYYFVKAGDELKDESKKLREKTDLVLYCLMNRSASVTASRDNAGNIIGLVVDMSANLSGKGSLSDKGE